MEHQFLGVVNQQAGSTVHDALGFAGGARGIEDVHRVIRIDRGERGSLAFTGFQGLIPGGNQFAGDRCFIGQLGNADHHLQGGQARDQLGEVGLAREHFAAITVAVDHNEG